MIESEKNIEPMITTTPEFQVEIAEAFLQMKENKSDEVVFGKGFVLTRAGSDAAIAWESKGETLDAFSIENIALIVISPGASS